MQLKVIGAPTGLLLSSLLLSSCSILGREAPRAVAEVPGTDAHAVHVGETVRTYQLHVPPQRPRRLGRAIAYPLVIVLHGSGANGETVRRMSGMDTIADVARFLVAYPNGSTGKFNLRSDWNAGMCCGPAESRNVDDVAFVRALIDSVAASMPVDRDRIFVAGFSDGGRMAYRLACAMSAQIAAVAVVAGSLVDPACEPTRQVPMVVFHGMADHEVPYSDSSYSTPRTAPPSVTRSLPPSVQFWAGTNGCKALTLRRQSAHVVFAHLDGCAAEIAVYSIDDGLHAWPGGLADGAEPTKEISASLTAWRFFVRHPLH